MIIEEGLSIQPLPEGQDYGGTAVLIDGQLAFCEGRDEFLTCYVLPDGTGIWSFDLEAAPENLLPTLERIAERDGIPIKKALVQLIERAIADAFEREITETPSDTSSPDDVDTAV